MCGDDRWLVYVVEEHHGWFFWSAEIDDGCWVRDESRATTYGTHGEAMVIAAQVSERERVDARVIRETELV